MDLILKMFILFSLTTSAAFNQVPSSGCNLITNENKCFSYFQYSSINWNDARANCQTWGGDLASIASAVENAAVDSIRSSSGAGSCWIGLNDIGTEGTYVWSDGSSSSYRNWGGGQPNNFNNEDCAYVFPITWSDFACSHTLLCYYCSLLNVSAFGRIVDSSTFERLNNNTILALDTTLYCVTENRNTPQVNWSYVDPVGIRSSLTVATNVTTGVSILVLTNSNSNPGNYSCQITRNQVDVTYMTEIISTIVPSIPPVNLTVYSLNSTAIQAEWNAPELIDQNGVLTSYQVRYNGSELDTAETFLNLSANTSSVILTGLLPNVYYCVIIRVENNAGSSEFSSPNCARTHEAIPSTPPVNITLYSLNSTAIQAEWNAPELMDQNGVLTSYQVKYNGSELDTTERSLNLSISTMSIILTGLLPEMHYCVMIRVGNGAGFSEFSSQICTRTHEANLTCRDEDCYVDTDMDTYPDLVSFCPQHNMTCKDNCPSEYNPDQNDCDNNGIGDVCDDTCEPETDNLFKLYWKCTKGGEVALVNCPNDMNTASRMCEQSGNWSTIIDTSHCVSNEYGSINNVTSGERLDIVIQVLNETMPTFSGDIIIIVDILDSTVDATAQSNQSEAIVIKTIQVIDFLTNSSQQQLLNQTQQTSGVVQKILSLLDRQAQVLAVNRSMDVRLSDSQNVFFETRTIKQDQVGDVVLTADNIKSDGQPPPSVTIPVQNMAGENGNMSVSVVVLRNIANLINSFADKISLGTRGLKLSYFSKFEIVTPVVSVQVFNDGKLITTNSDNTLVTLNLPLELTRIINSDNFYRPTCLFLANATSNSPQWRDEGIRNVSSTEVSADNVLACISGHSTAFVVLIGINNLEDQVFVLNILSYLGCSVSIICLVMSIGIYLLFGLKLLKKVYHFAHFQLSFSLLLLYLAFLFGVELAYVDVWFYIPCKMVTVLIEYLLLVVFLWMLLEGVIILIMVIWPFLVFTWKHFLTFFCVAWLTPLLYVIPFIPFFHDFYLSPPISSNVSFAANSCWLHSDVNTHIIYSVTAPIALIILVNLVIIVIVIVRYIVLVAKQRSLSKFHRVQKTALRLLRLILVLFPVLGFGWAFGLFAVYFNRAVFAWMFTILCSFQGLSILIFVLLLRRDIQKSIVKKLNLKPYFSTIQFRLTHRSSKKVDIKVCVTRQPATSTFQEPVAAIEEPEVDLDTPPSVIKVEKVDNCTNAIEDFNLANKFPNMKIENLSNQTVTGLVDRQIDWHSEIKDFKLKKNFFSDDLIRYEGIVGDLLAFYEDIIHEELGQVGAYNVKTFDNS